MDLTKYYFHNGTNNNENNNVIFGHNIEYTKMPIQADGFEFNGKQLPRPRLNL